MSRKVIAIVDRGMTDKTSIIVWQHEIPVLEEIHGEGAIVMVDPEKLTDADTAIVIKGTNQLVPNDSQNFRLTKDVKGNEVVEIVSLHKGEPIIVQKEIQRVPVVGLLKSNLGLETEFDGDPDEEYARLAQLYGMHTEEKISNVQRAYGRLSEGRFAQALGARSRKAA